MAVDWTEVLKAWGPWIAPTIVALGSLIVSIMNQLKINKSIQKVDENTILTKAGAVTASTNAKVAAVAASAAENKVDNLADQLNGKLEAKVRMIIREELAEMLGQLKEK